jgi:uncharacterized protein YqjF (DUF2071 family)
MWAAATIERRGDRIRYRGRRRWPGRGSAGYDLALDIGDPIGRPSDLERFLTGRWHLFAPGRLDLPPRAITLTRTTVAHAPWPLHTARVRRAEETLLVAAGLPAPGGEPTALFSPGVDTRFAPRVPALP